MIKHGVFIGLLLLLGAQPASAADLKEREGTFRTSDGVKLHFIEAGAGRTIVFIPGWTMAADIFEPQLAGLSPHFRVIALDPRSHGDSDKPADGNFLERHAQDIEELLTTLHASDVVLAGWSNGVPDVLAYVDRYGTAKLGGVVLIDGFVKVDSPDLQKAMIGMLETFQTDRAKFMDGFIRSMYKSKVSDEYIAHVKAQSAKAPTNTAVVEMLNVLVKGDYTPALAKIDKPVLFVCQSRLQPQAKIAHDSARNVRVEVLEGVGHALFVDAPAKFNDIVASFASSLPQSH